MPLKRIIDLCPELKAKMLRKGIQDLNVESKATMEGASCNMVQSMDLPKIRHDKVPKINVSINQKELKGVVLGGGSKFNVIDIARTLGLNSEPIAFNV